MIGWYWEIPVETRDSLVSWQIASLQDKQITKLYQLSSPGLNSELIYVTNQLNKHL